MDPGTWYYIIVLVISLIIGIAMAPKPQNAKPPALAEFDAPTIDEGTDIQWIHGECIVADPNIGWYGNLRTTPIRTKSGK